jgi:hypothetical protein
MQVTLTTTVISGQKADKGEVQTYAAKEVPESQIQAVT